MPAMVMNAVPQGTSPTSSTTTTSTSRSSKKSKSRRRHKDKASKDNSPNSNNNNTPPSKPSSPPPPLPEETPDPSTNAPRPPPPAKPAHTSKLALLSVHNALRMGARTQLNLTPPAARWELFQIVSKKKQSKSAAAAGGGGPLSLRRNLSFGRAPSMSSVTSRSTVHSRLEENEGSTMLDRVLGEGGQKEYEEAEEQYLAKFKETKGEEEDWLEEESSGDEDGLDVMLEEDPSSLRSRSSSQEEEEEELKEPLYPDGLEGTTQTAQGGGSNNLAFNFRKVKWFDAVTAEDRAEARKFLRQEWNRLKKLDVLNLTQHLKKMQRREKRRLEIEAGGGGRRNSLQSVTSEMDEEEETDPLSTSGHSYDVASLPKNMTPSLAAALVLESLSMTPKESLEGMAKCYEGIVAAGMALLESNTAGAEDSNRPSKKELVSALTPMLITTLAKPAGDTILALAKLQKTCGTKRYQRRFVQRIAPYLVRPSNAALWCLKHRDDMKAIFAATELILNASFEIFSSGWYDRGRTLLADSKRAETLQAAANQLKRLSAPHESDGFMNALTLPGKGMRRTGTLKDLAGSGSSNVGTEVLSERDILAVDTHIRQSIDFLFTRNWSRVTLQNAPPRDGESYPVHKKNAGITGGKSKPSIPEGLQVDPTSVQDHVSSPKRMGGGTASTVSSSIESLSPKGRSNESKRSSSGRKKSSKKGFEEATSPPHSPKPTEIESSYNSARASGDVHSPIPSSPRRTNSNIPPPMYADPSMSPSHSNQSVSGHTPAPLSPSNSMSNRRREHNQRFTSNSPGSTGAAQATYLRTLTSTAAERKRTVAACRALRAQIKRFEDAFYALHGRLPKGAERQPLATTYAQYREWKRAIRADAACRIQALFRGSSTRGRLFNCGDQRIADFIKRNRADRASRIRKPDPIVTLVPESANSPNSFQRKSSRRSSNGGVSAAYGVEVVMGENPGSNNRPASRWDPQPNHQMGGDESLGYTHASSQGPQHSNPYTPRGESSVASSASPFSFGDITLSELQTQKRELKQQLKQYDLNFHKQHGRMPKKVEKEPIRHLYERYNSLKVRIASLEREAQNPGPKNASTPSQRNSGFMENTGSSDDSPSNPPPRNAPRSSSSGRSSTSSGAPQDLASLKTEKQLLHQMLRSYEKDFFKIHKKQVSSYADIRPVASQYRRYKEIKKSILALQQAGEK